MEKFNTVLEKAISEFGAENIFMLRKDYHGYYEDDYCYYTYYNNVTGEILKDTWTTAGYCVGNYECMSIHEGLKNGLVNKTLFYKTLFDSEMNILKNMKMTDNPVNMDNRDFLCSLNLMVTVSKGRKFKGSGYLVGYITKSYQYAAPRFHNHYYGTRDFGTTTTAYAKIYVPETNTINYATLGYVVIDNVEEFYNNYKKYLISNLLSTTPENLVPDSNSNFGYRIEYGKLTFAKYLEKFHKNNIVMSASVKDEEVAKKEDKIKKLRDEKMPGILKWVRECTDKKTEEDINALAEHIFKKKYM